jgi:CheY-like chemotaxis protein
MRFGSLPRQKRWTWRSRVESPQTRSKATRSVCSKSFRTFFPTPSSSHPREARSRCGLRQPIPRQRSQIADTGQGIAAEFRPHIFERFTQADTSTTRRHGGLGLGLAIVKALVERHGGTVHAESRGVGKGATFTVRIPVLAPHAVEEVERLPLAETPAAAPSRLDGIRVLLVEDDADGRQLLTLTLEIAGAKVEAIGSVREALSALNSFRPDVLVSDVGMPDEDGYALVRQLRARDADRGGNIPAIALTGYVTPEDRARLLAAGFQMHLRKPVEPSDIVAAVASLAAIGGR